MSLDLEVAVFPPYRSNVTSDPMWLREWAVTVEELGFDAVVLPEHTVVAADYEHRYPYSEDGVAPIDAETAFPDPLECLSFIAACTDHIRLGTAVLVLPNHHPVMLAKRLATLDRLSGGRVELSIGGGWMREEIEAHGVAYADRGRYMDESLDLLRLLWNSPPEGVTFRGAFHQVDRVRSLPAPVQRHIPLYAGGHSRAAARRAGLRCDGFHPLGVALDGLQELLDVARQAAVESGRDPDALKVTFGQGLLDDLGTIDLAVEAAHRAGAHRVQLSSRVADLDSLQPAMAKAAEHLGLTPRRDQTRMM